MFHRGLNLQNVARLLYLSDFCLGYACSDAEQYSSELVYITATSKETICQLDGNLTWLLFLSLCVRNNTLCAEIYFIL